MTGTRSIGNYTNVTGLIDETTPVTP